MLHWMAVTYLCCRCHNWLKAFEWFWWTRRAMQNQEQTRKLRWSSKTTTLPSISTVIACCAVLNSFQRTPLIWFVRPFVDHVETVQSRPTNVRFDHTQYNDHSFFCVQSSAHVMFMGATILGELLYPWTWHELYNDSPRTGITEWGSLLFQVRISTFGVR